MARFEASREDLMGEATALARRAELQLPGEAHPVVAGFRAAGVLSIYFGQDPAYHFNRDGRLRRAFLAGDLYRTQGATLACLTRVRTPADTQLARRDLPPAELGDFLVRMDARLSRLHEAVSSGRAIVLRSVPGDDDLLPELAAALARILELDERLAPPFAGRR